jgi:hypothetical protein
MAFVRSKKIKGNLYYYLVESKRVNGRVMQKVLRYFGSQQPPAKVFARKKRTKPQAKRKKSR